MEEIFFPSQYKKSLLNKKKNTTIRIKESIGKYKEGKIYFVKSYSGNDWGTKIKIQKIIKTKLKDLTNFNIPKRSIHSLKRKKGVSDDEIVELIKFEVLD